jgi:L-arabinokinase
MSHNIERDFAAFEEARIEHAGGFFTDRFAAARAPGRLDVMGGIADYSGSLVAEMPIAQATIAGAQVGGTGDGSVHVRSLNAESEHFDEDVHLPAALFVNPVSLLRWAKDAPKSQFWAAYVAGCVGILRAEGLWPKNAGAKILVRSDVPLGAGVSSSAAVEVATMRALCAAHGISLDGLTLARLCQRVENEIVDAPCGIMDQVTSALGLSDELLLLLCQPATVQGTLKIPDGWRVFGIDSCKKHSVAGHGYTDVRIAAFMGAKILADTSGEGFGGYLCNVTPERYAEICPDGLPETLTGAEFIAKHSGILDSVTRVNPSDTYAVRAAAEHAIFEMRRVSEFVELLKEGSDASMAVAGSRMLTSHASYSRCGLGSAETDLLADLALSCEGVAGAKITGGGSGGTVCVLCRTDQEESVIQTLAEQYSEQTGIAPRIIRGTSPGALATEPRLS